MKILRIRRGFTTNSSAFTEWVPPPGSSGMLRNTFTTPGESSSTTPAPGGAPGGSATAPGASPMLPGGPPTASPSPVAAGPQPTVSVSGGSQVQASGHAPGNLGGNSLVIGGVAGAVLLGFVIERVVRRRARRGAAREDDDE
jgi:hypothetical protein